MLRDDQYHFGIDADLKKKFQDKYDPNKAAAVSKWVEALTKTKMTGDLQADLKSGVALCKLLNTIAPNTVKAPNAGNQPFVQRENIVSFLSGCKKLGMKETDVFVTQDLFEGDNIVVVIDALISLGLVAKNMKSFKGPQLEVSGGKVLVAGAEGKSNLTRQPSKNTETTSSASSGSSVGRVSVGGKFCSGCGTARGSGKFCADCGAAY
jgi:hypothetical protein